MKEENALDFFMKELGLTKEGKVETVEKGIVKISDAYDRAMEVYKQQIIKHSVELCKELFSQRYEVTGKSPEEIVDSYFKEIFK